MAQAVLPFLASSVFGKVLDACEMRECYVKPCRCATWACPTCSVRLGISLFRRLRERFAGCRVVMATLTVDRSRHSAPVDAWRSQRRNRYVARAIDRWCAAHGWDSHARWIAKMELQRDGFPHWHVLIHVPDEAEFRRLGELDGYWRMGFSNLRHGKWADLRYVCKYVCKGNDLSALDFSGLPAKGVTWVTTARGFWGDAVDPSVMDSWQTYAYDEYGNRLFFDREVEGDISFDPAQIQRAADLAAQAAQSTLFLRVQCCGGSVRFEIRPGLGQSRSFRWRLPVPYVEAVSILQQLLGVQYDGDSVRVTIDDVVDWISILPFSEDGKDELLGFFASWICEESQDFGQGWPDVGGG